MKNFSDTIGYKTLKIVRRMFHIIILIGLLAMIINYYYSYIGILLLSVIIVTILISIVLIGFGLVRHFGEYYFDKK